MRELGAGFHTYTEFVFQPVARRWKSLSPSRPSFSHVLPPSRLRRSPKGLTTRRRMAAAVEVLPRRREAHVVVLRSGRLRPFSVFVHRETVMARDHQPFS